MSKEQGILAKENSENILRNIDGSFFKGSFSKLGSGASRKVDENMPAMVAMHEDMHLASGRLPEVKDMRKAQEIVKYAETQYLASQAVRQQGGMNR